MLLLEELMQVVEIQSLEDIFDNPVEKTINTSNMSCLWAKF